MTDHGTTADAPTPTAVEQTKSAAGTAVDQTKVVADDAKRQARRLGQEATAQLRGQVDEQTARVARGLEDVGRQLTTMADKTDDPDGQVSSYTRQAGEGVQRLAARLDDGGLDQMLDDVKRFARNRPGVFLLGALGAGFVVGRLLKAVDLGEVARGTGEDGDGRGDREQPARTTDPYAPLASGPATESLGERSEVAAPEAAGAEFSAPETYPAEPAEGAWGQR
jgi:hypothetical protein